MEGKISHTSLRKEIQCSNPTLLITFPYANSVLDRDWFYL